MFTVTFSEKVRAAGQSQSKLAFDLGGEHEGGPVRRHDGHRQRPAAGVPEALLSTSARSALAPRAGRRRRWSWACAGTPATRRRHRGRSRRLAALRGRGARAHDQRERPLPGGPRGRRLPGVGRQHLDPGGSRHAGTRADVVGDAVVGRRRDWRAGALWTRAAALRMSPSRHAARIGGRTARARYRVPGHVATGRAGAVPWRYGPRGRRRESGRRPAHGRSLPRRRDAPQRRCMVREPEGRGRRAPRRSGTGDGKRDRSRDAAQQPIRAPRRSRPATRVRGLLPGRRAACSTRTTPTAWWTRTTRRTSAASW